MSNESISPQLEIPNPLNNIDPIPIPPWSQRFFGLYCAAFVMFVIAWIYVIPGYVAWREGVLTSDGVVKHLKGAAASSWAAYQRHHGECESKIRIIAAQLESPTTEVGNVSSLIALRQQYVAEMNAKPPIIVAGMVGDWLSEIWAMSYLTLGCLIAVWAYPKLTIRLSRVILWTLFLYLLSVLQLLMRNGLLNTLDRGRTVYSYVNWDVSKSSYVLQDLRQAVMFFLICVFWDLGAQRLAILKQSLATLKTQEKSTNERALRAITIFRRTLALWQESSLFLLVVFVPWTFFYWDQIANYKDSRYLPAALTIDLIWIVTWFVSCRPLLVASEWWNDEKLRLIANWTGDHETLNALLVEASSSSELQVLAASATAVGSLLIPLIKALI